MQFQSRSRAYINYRLGYMYLANAQLMIYIKIAV